MTTKQNIIGAPINQHMREKRLENITESRLKLYSDQKLRLVKDLSRQEINGTH